MEDRRFPTDAPVEVEVPNKKPFRSCSNYVISTARREIHGDRLHRTGTPPNLLGFFHTDTQYYGAELRTPWIALGSCPRPSAAASDDGRSRLGASSPASTGVPAAPVMTRVTPSVTSKGFLPRKNYARFASLLAAGTSVDPSFLFLRKALPEIRHLFLLDSRNGLFLFGNTVSLRIKPDFVVCNPATEQWVTVPRCVRNEDIHEPEAFTRITEIYLLFDPAVSSHFRVVVFWKIDGRRLYDASVGITVHVYSSETGVWSHSETDWSEEERQGPLERWRRSSDEFFVIDGSLSAFVDGMLYFTLLRRKQLVQVDLEGKTRGIISTPQMDDSNTNVFFICQSQGRLHCIIEEGHSEFVVEAPGHRNGGWIGNQWASDELSIWVLEDMDNNTKEWVFKNKVNSLLLFGERRKRSRLHTGFNVVAMHPDRNLIFIHQHWDFKIISYDFDRQEVCDVGTIKSYPPEKIIPYTPYLSELFLGVLGGHK